MASIIRKLFRRKKKPPLVCAIDLDLDHDPNHQHTAACFIDFEPLAIVEFFQSQGCQACPPAIPGILETVQGPNVLLLSYNVTFFDHLGWKDTHGSTQWDNRQRAYVKKWERKTLQTPLVIANGAADGPGAGGRHELMDIVARGRAASGNHPGWHVYVDANETDVRIDSDKVAQEGEAPFDVYVATYTPAVEKVKVGKGFNKGKKLEHRNVVTGLMKIGEWSGGTSVVPLPVARASMKAGEEAVAWVQAQGAGMIVGAAKL